MFVRSSTVLVIVLSCVVSACSGTGAPVDSIASYDSVASKPADNDLYVGLGTSAYVDVFAPGGTSPKRVLHDRISRPVALAFDRSGNLYVANYTRYGISVYAPGSSSPAREIKKGIDQPSALAFDAAGNVYVANSRSDTVTVYAAGTNQLLETIPLSMSDPLALLVDRRGNIYVANRPEPNAPSTIAVYSPNGSGLLWNLTPPGQGKPSMAFDKQDNVYYTNDGGNQVTVYKAYTNAVLRTISGASGVLAVDSKDDLYVGSGFTVLVYPKGATKPSLGITDGITYPTAFAFDRKDDLFVANLQNRNVTAYAPGATTPFETTEELVNSPFSLAFGP